MLEQGVARFRRQRSVLEGHGPVLRVVTLVLTDPPGPVIEPLQLAQVLPAPAHRLACDALVRRIAATELAEDGVRPLVDAVVPAEHLMRPVLLQPLAGTVPPVRPTRAGRVLGRSGARLQPVARAPSKNDRFVPLALLIVHLPATLTRLFARSEA